MSLHATLSMLGYLLTAWGRLRAGDYANMRRGYTYGYRGPHGP